MIKIELFVACGKCMVKYFSITFLDFITEKQFNNLGPGMILNCTHNYYSSPCIFFLSNSKMAPKLIIFYHKNKSFESTNTFKEM